MRFDMDTAVPVLRRTPGVLDAMLRDLPREWLDANEGPDTWSPFDVLGHLRQIARGMAKQYTEAAGPWREYLPVLSE